MFYRKDDEYLTKMSADYIPYAFCMHFNFSDESFVYMSLTWMEIWKLNAMKAIFMVFVTT